MSRNPLKMISFLLYCQTEVIYGTVAVIIPGSSSLHTHPPQIWKTRIRVSCPDTQESEVIAALFKWVMNSDQLCGASELINFAIVVQNGHCWFLKGKMCHMFHSRASGPSKSFQSNESRKFVSSRAEEKLRCVSPTVVLTAERLDHTWQMTLTGYNSAEGQQSAAIKSQGFIGHIDFILMTGASEINLLFTGSDPTNRTKGEIVLTTFNGGSSKLKPAFIKKKKVIVQHFEEINTIW